MKKHRKKNKTFLGITHRTVRPHVSPLVESQNSRIKGSYKQVKDIHIQPFSFTFNLFIKYLPTSPRVNLCLVHRASSKKDYYTDIRKSVGQ